MMISPETLYEEFKDMKEEELERQILELKDEIRDLRRKNRIFNQVMKEKDIEKLQALDFFDEAMCRPSIKDRLDMEKEYLKMAQKALEELRK